MKTILIHKLLSRQHPAPSSPYKSVKTNKNQSVITKKFNIIFRGKSYHGSPCSWRDASANQGLSNTTRLKSKFIRVKFKNSLRTINDWMFSPAWDKLCHIVGKVKISTRLSLVRDFTDCILIFRREFRQGTEWDGVYKTFQGQKNFKLYKSRVVKKTLIK